MQGYSITKQSLELRNTYNYLTTLNEYNFRTKMIYSLYLRNIENDDFEACEIYEQLNSMRKNLLVRKNEKEELDMNGSNSHASVIMISGSKQNMGEVLNANNELFELLGYTRESVYGASINRLMPGIIASEHDNRLTYYITQNKEKAGLLELIILATHKNGVMIPCLLKKRIIPNMHNGIQFRGFGCKCHDISRLLQKKSCKSDDLIDPSSVMFLTDNNWRIHGINESACQLFNINPEEVNIRKYFYEDEKSTLIKIFPKFAECFSQGDTIAHNNMTESMIQIDVAALQSEISTSIDKNTVQEKENSIHGNKTPLFTSTINVRVYEHIYESYSNQNIRMCLIKFEKSGEDIIKAITKEEEKSSLIFGSQKEKEINIEIIDNQSQSTSSSAASGIINSRTVKELKSKLHSQQWTTLLLVFLRMGIILCMVLIIIGSIRFMQFHYLSIGRKVWIESISW